MTGVGVVSADMLSSRFVESVTDGLSQPRRAGFNGRSPGFNPGLPEMSTRGLLYPTNTPPVNPGNGSTSKYAAGVPPAADRSLPRYPASRGTAVGLGLYPVTMSAF